MKFYKKIAFIFLPLRMYIVCLNDDEIEEENEATNEW